MQARAWVGTSGWNYKHWRNDIYPPKLPQNRWLDYMSQRFDTVEVNTSFYAIPKHASIDVWQQESPPHFRFALKLWRGITHYRKLKNTEEFTARFLDVAQTVTPGRRAPLLIQLPPNQGKDTGKLQEYLGELRRTSDGHWQIAVEFRNASWLQPDVLSMLDRECVALCLHDMQGRGAVDEPNDASFLYIRRHGTSEGRYAGSYSPAAIAHDGERIREWVRQGRDVYIYYNNDIGGHAFRNALDLKRDIIDGL